MTVYSVSIRRIGTGIVLAAVMLSLLPFLSVSLQERNYLQREIAFIGKIHERMPEKEAEVLGFLYDTEFTEEELLSGNETLISRGIRRRVYRF